MGNTNIGGDYVQGDKVGGNQYTIGTVNIAHHHYPAELRMSISTILMQAAGPTLGRMILTTLLGGTPQVGDIAGTLTDSLIKLTDDYKAQRNGERLFEQIGDEAAEKLAVIFEMEGENVAPAQQEVIAQEVGRTLEQHALRLLVECQFDRHAFDRALSQLEPPSAVVHASEKQLFQRVLVETSNNIFAVAQDLPHFHRETAAQLLQNTNDLRQQMDEVLTKVAQIYKTSQQQNPEQKMARFEQQYRQLLSCKLDHIKLFGMPQGDNSRQPLSIAFVQLRATRQEKEGGKQEHSHHERERTLTPVQIFAQGRRLLIVGPAGAGKTTLLKWLAVRAANQDQLAPKAEEGEEPEPAPLPMWHGKIPFLIRLRDFVEGKLPTLTQLPRSYPGLGILGEPDEEWMRARLDDGRALVLVDGLDEVTKERRQAAYTWLEGLLTLYPHATYLVTTRPSTLSEVQTATEFQHHGFHFFHLQTMDGQAVDQFVTQWHTAMGHEESRLPDEEKVRLPERAEALRREFDRQPALRRLAETPLLCAMLCALNVAREGQLPLDRIQLYRACLEMLLEGRDKERKVDLRDYGAAVHLNLREKERLLGHVAYWMMDNGLSVIPSKEAEAEIGRFHAEPQAVWRFLVERSGLLQSQAVDEFDFAHRTFQEYLAATQIAYQNNVRAVCQRAEKPEWRETILLTAGVLNDEAKQVQLLSRLGKQAQKQKEPRPIHVLALECLSLMPMPSQELVALTVPHAEELVDEEARGKDKEMRLGLNLGGTAVTNLSPLSALHNLQYLLLYRTAVSDLTPLASLPDLQELNLWQTAVSDLTPLVALSNLQELSLGKTAVSDLTPLVSLSNLQELNLNGTGVSDLTLLAALHNLQTLALSYTGVSDLTPLAALHNLQILYLVKTGVSDLTPLVALHNLQKLSLIHTTVSDLTLLAALHNLQTLYLGHTGVSDLTPLATLHNLQSLSLWQTGVSDLTPLSTLHNLQEIDLSYMSVSDLTPLATLHNLQSLFLRHTGVSDLTLLSNLTQLRVLDLRGTAVTGLAPLSEHPHLAIWIDSAILANTTVPPQLIINPDKDPWRYWEDLQRAEKAQQEATDSATE